MALTVTLLQLRNSVRKFANAQGTTALLRHPDADINDYINRALGSLYRRLTTAQPDQRYLATDAQSTSDGVSVYALPSNFDHLISVDLVANGAKVWLTSYEMNERPMLTDSSEPFTGIPFCYRLRAGNVEFLPIPQDSYTYTLWYVPTTTQLSGDASTFDTIDRLDDYVIAYAARMVAVKDKNWDLVGECRTVCAEMAEEIAVIGRQRDQNSPPRITDVYQANRWGRVTGRRRFV